MSSIKKVITSKKILILLIIALTFNNIYSIHQNFLLESKWEERKESEGDLIIWSTYQMLIDSEKFLLKLDDNTQMTDELLIQTEENIKTNLHIAYLLNLRSLEFIYRSMEEFMVIHTEENTISIEELTSLLVQLNKDIKDYIIMFWDLNTPDDYIKDRWWALEGGPLGSDKVKAYNRAHGLETEFYQKEKEFMDHLIRKYHNM